MNILSQWTFKLCDIWHYFFSTSTESNRWFWGWSLKFWGVYTRGSVLWAIALCQKMQNFTFLHFQQLHEYKRELSAFYTCHEKERWSENSHAWKKSSMDFERHFYCFGYLRATLLQIPPQYMDNSLSGAHSFFTYFRWRWSLDLQVSAMTQSKFCVKPCGLNSTDLLWKHLRSCWATEELKICPGRCRWSWLTQDCTLNYRHHVDHEKWFY